MNRFTPRQGPARVPSRHCSTNHNCKAAGGTEVRWSFPLLCNNKPTSRVSNVSLNCNGAEGALDETKQH